MKTKEIIRRVEEISGLRFWIEFDDENLVPSLELEKMNDQYFNYCNHLQTSFSELYIEGQDQVLFRVSKLLSESLSLWSTLSEEAFYIDLNFERKEFEHLKGRLTSDEFKGLARLKLYYIQSLLDSITKLTRKDNQLDKLFSVSEWACIFYYAYQTKLLNETKNTTTAIKEFMEKHDLRFSKSSFRNEYYNAKKRINQTNDFPISKLKKILPFCKVNYNKAFERIENDIDFLEEQLTDY